MIKCRSLNPILYIEKSSQTSKIPRLLQNQVKDRPWNFFLSLVYLNLKFLNVFRYTIYLYIAAKDTNDVTTRSHKHGGVFLVTCEK